MRRSERACGVALALAMTMVIGSCVCRAADSGSAPTTMPADVSRLVADLTSDDYNQRESAQVALVRMGPEAEGPLNEILRGEQSPEAQARVQQAIQQIEDNLHFGPSVITMHYKDEPLQTVLDDFSAQAGADLGVHRPSIEDFASQTTVSIDLDHATFWQSLRALNDACGLSPDLLHQQGPMVLATHGDQRIPRVSMYSPVAQECGPMLIVPIGAREERTVEYGRGGGVSRSSLSLSLLFIIEPKLRIVGGINSDWMKQCVDEKGNSLMIGRRQNFAAMGGLWQGQLHANLADPPDIGEKIAKLDGELKFTVQSKSNIVEVDGLDKDIDKAKNLTNNMNGANVTLTGIQQQDGGFPQQGVSYLVHLSIADKPNGRGPLGMLAQDLMNSIQLLDAQGEPFLPMIGGRTPNSDEITLTFVNSRPMNLGAQRQLAKLRWEVTTETRQVDVPFELHDLALP